MVKIGKTLAAFLTLIIVMSCLTLLIAKPVYGQTPTPSPTLIPTPSVPTFTVQLVGPPYTQPTTYQLDQNTGQIVANIGYTNKYSQLVIVVQNQPFDSQYGSIYYNVTMNGTPFVRNGDNGASYPEQTAGSDTTNITFSILGGWGYGSIVGQQVSIQVQAMLGKDQWGRTLAFASQGNYFSGTHSDLSNPQTISVPANVPLSSSSSPIPTSSSSPTSNSTPTSTTPSSSPSTSFLQITNTIFLIVIVILLAVIIVLLLLMRRRKSTN